MNKWIRQNKIEFTILIAILLLAAFFRFYHLPEYMTFLGDEGRDAIVIKKLLVGHDLPFIGPPTSIGNMYLGPLYYYMMAVPMAIFWLNPIAAAAQVALIGVLTVFLIYYLGKSWYGKWAGLISAYLYAISPVNIIYSRSSWNPNPAPFFALLSVLGIYKAHKTGNFLWFILTGIAIAFAVQMHYLALILVPIIGILWAYEITLMSRQKLERTHFIKGTLLAVAAFLILMSPLVLFDLKHNFMNFHAITAFFSNRETTVNVNPLNSLSRTAPIYMHNLVGRYLSGDMLWSNWLFSLLIMLPILVAFYRKAKGAALKWSGLALGLWLSIGVVGLALYKQNIYDHYLGFLNPVPFILFGAIIAIPSTIHVFKGKYKQLNLITPIAIFLLLITLSVINLGNSPLKNAPNMQLQRTQAVSKFIIDQAGGKPFNFALLSEHNYDSAYQFYLDKYEHKPLTVPDHKTMQLFVVCEDPVCDPTNSPKYEIAGFGMSKIESMNKVLGVKVYKLIPNPTGAP